VDGRSTNRLAGLLAGVAVAWFIFIALADRAGGFTVYVLGLRVSLHDVRKPLLIALGLLTAAALLAPEALVSARRRLEAISPGARRALPWLVGSAAALVISLLKAKQHSVLQTSAFDLAIQSSVAWNTSQGRLFFDAIQGMNYLGDHFSPIHVALALIYRLWPSPLCLMVLQSAGFGLAAVAVYRLALRHVGSVAAALLVMLLFLLNPYLHAISAFDFHPVALAVPIFLWLLECLETGRMTAFVLLALVAATVEETLLPPLAGVGVYVFFLFPERRRLGLLLAVLAAGFFVVELKLLMPYFLGEDRLTHLHRYANLGGSIEEIVVSVWRDPLLAVRELVTPADKPRALGALLLSVGFLPLLAPLQLLLAVIPILQVQLTSYEVQWQFSHQYSATALPFLVFAGVHGLARACRALARQQQKLALPSPRATARIAVLAAVAAVLTGPRMLPEYLTECSPARVAAAHRILAEIPSDQSVCASQAFVPHLVNRPRVSMLRPRSDGTPELDDAEVVVVDALVGEWGAFPFSLGQYQAAVEHLRRSPEYALVREEEGMLLFRRAHPGAAPDSRG
jgi:uncharacterized membrane protein